MLNKLKEWWKAIAAVVGAVVGFLLLRQYLQKDLKAKLENANTAGQDAVLETKKDAVEAALKQAADAGKSLKDEHEKAKDTAEDASKEEVIDFYKKRLK